MHCTVYTSMGALSAQFLSISGCFPNTVQFFRLCALCTGSLLQRVCSQHCVALSFVHSLHRFSPSVGDFSTLYRFFVCALYAQVLSFSGCFLNTAPLFRLCALCTGSRLLFFMWLLVICRRYRFPLSHPFSMVSDCLASHFNSITSFTK